MQNPNFVCHNLTETTVYRVTTTVSAHLPETFHIRFQYTTTNQTPVCVTVMLALTLSIFSHCQVQQLQSSVSLCRSIDHHTLQVLGRHDIHRSTRYQSLRLQSSNEGSACRHNGRLQGSVCGREINKLTKKNRKMQEQQCMTQQGNLPR